MKEEDLCSVSGFAIPQDFAVSKRHTKIEFVKVNSTGYGLAYFKFKDKLVSEGKHFCLLGTIESGILAVRGCCL